MRRLFLLAFIWGWSFLFIKVILEDAPPTFLAWGRIVLGLAVLAVAMGRRREPLPERRYWGHLVVLGLTMSVLPCCATLQSAAALTRELKRVKAGSAAGQTRELRRALETAETLAAQLAEAARSLRAGFDLDEQAYLASGGYAKELLAVAAAAGVDMFEEDDRLLCYPSLVRILPDQAAIEIDRKRERRLRPSVLVDLLAGRATQGPPIPAEPFLDSLRAAYELVVARDGKKPDAVVRLVDIWAVLTRAARDRAGNTPSRSSPATCTCSTRAASRRTARSSRRLRWSGQHRHQERRRADHGHPQAASSAATGGSRSRSLPRAAGPAQSERLGPEASARRRPREADATWRRGRAMASCPSVVAGLGVDEYLEFLRKEYLAEFIRPRRRRRQARCRRRRPGAARFRSGSGRGGLGRGIPVRGGRRRERPGPPRRPGVRRGRPPARLAARLQRRARRL